jgi:hypothetical protein
MAWLIAARNARFPQGWEVSLIGVNVCMSLTSPAALSRSLAIRSNQPKTLSVQERFKKQQSFRKKPK